MTNKYQYYIYGYQIESNISLPIENILQNYNNIDFFINFIRVAAIKEHNDIRIWNKENYYIIKSPIVEYNIDIDRHCIIVFAPAEENCISTLFNIPFSIISIHHGEILVHACSIYDKCEIILFCGKKGIGKSTLISHLAKKFCFFSDDTVNIRLNNERPVGFKSGNYLRINEDAYLTHEIIQPFQSMKKNLQNKAYVDCRSLNISPFDGQGIKIRSIYHLSRHRNDNVSIEIIENNLLKEAILLANIVGISYYPLSIINIIRASNIFRIILDHVHFYRIKIPNDLKKIDFIAKQIINHPMFVWNNEQRWI